MSEQPREAGRELDWDIALLMGLAPCPHGPRPGQFSPLTGRCNECGGSPPEHYSTDIAAAWQVMAYVRNLPFSRRHIFADVLVGIISERILGHGRRIHPVEVILHVGPADICEAALRVFGAG